MVMTRHMMTALIDPKSPPASIDTVVPHSAATVPLPSPMQREHDKDRDTKSRRIVNISDITRIRLRRRIQEIYDMLTHVVEGYGTFYYNKHGNLLPQETVDKITCLYHTRIECRCIEVGLTVDEEREWDSDDANVDVDALSESGEESEEHDSDDVCFYSEDDDDDVDNGLSFEELKQCHHEHYLQQCKDRNSPLAKAMIEMIENPPPPFQSSDDDENTDDVLIGKRKREGNKGEKEN
jgi:hypothetical protein